MIKIDKNKTIQENYPNLIFDAATESNINLFDAEQLISTIQHEKFRNYIYIWEYGYYFISYFISKSAIDNSETPIAALFTEAHNALRGSFLLNLRGYHSDAITLLRKVHESVIRSLAIKKNPKNIWNIVQASDIRKTEHSVGLDLNRLYNLESSFTHSNKLKVFRIGIDLNAGKTDISVEYGPQVKEKEFSLTAKISIVWIFFLIKAAPKLFPGRGNEYWLSRYEESAKLMKNFLEESKSSLTSDCNQIEKSLEKM